VTGSGPKKPAKGTGQKNSRAKALQGDPYLILKPPAPLSRLCSVRVPDFERGGSVEPAPLDHPPKTWTAFPSADIPRRDRALRTYSIFDPMSSPYRVPARKKFYEDAAAEHLPANIHAAAAPL
jgi:hypothetical protein